MLMLVDSCKNQEVCNVTHYVDFADTCNCTKNKLVMDPMILVIANTCKNVGSLELYLCQITIIYITFSVLTSNFLKHGHQVLWNLLASLFVEYPMYDNLTKRCLCFKIQTPLESSSIDVAVFCLSLMGTNFSSYLQEAHRVLKPWFAYNFYLKLFYHSTYIAL